MGFTFRENSRKRFSHFFGFGAGRGRRVYRKTSAIFLYTNNDDGLKSFGIIIIIITVMRLNDDNNNNNNNKKGNF